MPTSDWLIIGGGAAGLMAAGAACAAGQRVTLLEHNPKGTGQKLLITGKGRCNVTNDCDAREFLRYVRRNPRFLYSCLFAFPPAAAMQLFESLGVPLKVERGRRVFPQSDRAADILAALRAYAAGAQVVAANADGLLIENGACAGAVAGGRAYRARRVLLATGGVSYPATGSDGSGYALARQAGHTIVPPQPSLCSLVSPDAACRRMMGLSLRNVGLTLLEDGKPVFAEQGEALFTHFGLSGPLVLSASAHMNFQRDHYTLHIDLKPALDAGKLDARLVRDFTDRANQNMGNALGGLLPQSMIPVVASRAGIPLDTKAHDLRREQRRSLLETLKDFSVEVSGPRPVEEAIVTAGGVKVGEVDPKTMQSKKVPGLFFAGELLDVDAYTGGFNLQIAWATGWVAGQAVTEYLEKKDGAAQ